MTTRRCCPGPSHFPRTDRPRRRHIKRRLHARAWLIDRIRYGGYVRYVVGIVLTVLIGRYAILALNRYLERQKLAEQQPDAQRREELSYDVALTRLGKGVCPGCERGVDLKNDKIDFCPHCGIGLFDHCGKCSTRKSAFAHFCHACGSKRLLASG